MDDGGDARRLGLRPHVGRLQALGQLAEARGEAHVLLVKARACLLDDLHEAS